MKTCNLSYLEQGGALTKFASVTDLLYIVQQLCIMKDSSMHWHCDPAVNVLINAWLAELSSDSYKVNFVLGSGILAIYNELYISYIIRIIIIIFGYCEIMRCSCCVISLSVCLQNLGA